MPVITITPEQAIGRFGKQAGRYAPLNGANGRYLLRLSDNRIVTPDHDVLTEKEVAELRDAWKKARKGRAPSPGELDRAWADRAIYDELGKLITFAGTNPHKPDSEYWKSLCRIAGAVKGAGKLYFRPSEVLTLVLKFSPDDMKWKLANRERDIVYLWGRAMNLSTPRYRGKK